MRALTRPWGTDCAAAAQRVVAPSTLVWGSVDDLRQGSLHVRTVTIIVAVVGALSSVSLEHLDQSGSGAKSGSYAAGPLHCLVDPRRRNPTFRRFLTANAVRCTASPLVESSLSYTSGPGWVFFPLQALSAGIASEPVHAALRRNLNSAEFQYVLSRSGSCLHAHCCRGHDTVAGRDPSNDPEPDHDTRNRISGTQTHANTCR